MRISTRITIATIFAVMLVPCAWAGDAAPDGAPAGQPEAVAATGPQPEDCIQVAIESRIWELVYDSQFDLGMNWSWLQDNPDADLQQADLNVPALNPAKPFGARVQADVASTDSGRLRANLETAIGRNRATLLASPTIVVANAQRGRFHSGDKIPFITLGSVGTAQQVIETKHDTGVVLEVQPIIRNDDFVELAVNTNISRVIGYEDVSGSRLPIISERTAEATILVKNQGTVIMGGLYEETERETKRSVPIIGKVPLIGKAFESTNRSTVRTEVMVEITPTILNAGDDFQPEHIKIRKTADDGDYVAEKILGPELKQRLENSEDELENFVDPDGTQVTQDVSIEDL